MSITFKTSAGNSKVFGKIDNIANLTSRGVRAGMFESGNGLVKRANTNILSGIKTGRVYIVRTAGGRKRRHISSAPSETHANLTGTARRSLSYQLKGTHSLEFGYGVSSGKGAPEYVGWLEFGTRKMKARPTLQNALKDERGNMVQHFENGIKEQFR